MADKNNIDHHTPSPSSSTSPTLQLTNNDTDSNTTTSKTIKRNIGKDSARETKKKKKKKCPAALDKIQQQGDFSFSFDTNFDMSAPEFTPKFGSFNSELVLELKPEEEREDGCLRSRKRNREQGVEESKEICEDGID